MRLSKTSLIAASFAVALSALGAASVSAQGEDVVKARQDLMKVVGSNTKILGDMASGKAAFDATAAEAAKAALLAASSEVGSKFETQGEGETEAKPEIWTNWEDFLAKAEGTKVAVEGVDASSLDGVKAGMGAIGASCKACHSDYRI